MKPEPIDYSNPLGISKKEWTKVLGANLALLLLVYAVALICTLCGSDLFLLNFVNDDLQRVEETLRGWGVYPLVQTLFATIEAMIMTCFVAKAKPKWWLPVAYFGVLCLLNILLTAVLGQAPSWITFATTLACVISGIFLLKKERDRWFVYLYRLAICYAFTFILNEAIGLFRTLCFGVWKIDYSNSALFALNAEYELALGLLLGFMTLILPSSKKGGNESCPTFPDASGSSPTTKNSSPKNSKIARTNLPPKFRKRLLWLKAKVIIIQTTSLIVIAALPWFGGRPVEFALVYASFCITRVILGFSRSLHFKSELACVTLGALCFWALTFLAPSAEASIIMSLVYGAGLALGFRLYWELHDLMMYRKASKTDRYAMLYVVFKGNVSPKHINGVMRAKGYSDKIEIEMVQMYMRKDKVEYIASYFTFAKITVEKKLTEIASDLYNRR